jgi:hypothetical protein
LNFVAVLLVAVKNVASQHVPSEVLNCTTIAGSWGNGSVNAGFARAATMTLAFSGTVPALSVTAVTPSGVPVLLLNFQLRSSPYVHGLLVEHACCPRIAGRVSLRGR